MVKHFPVRERHPISPRVMAELANEIRSFKDPRNPNVSAKQMQLALIEQLAKHPTIPSAFDLSVAIAREVGRDGQLLPWLNAANSLNIRLAQTHDMAFQGVMTGIMKPVKAGIMPKVETELRKHKGALKVEDLAGKMGMDSGSVRHALNLLEPFDGARRRPNEPSDRNGQTYEWYYPKNIKHVPAPKRNWGYRLMSFIGDGTQSVEQLHKGLGIDHQTAKVQITNLKEAGFLEEQRAGLYGGNYSLTQDGLKALRKQQKSSHLIPEIGDALLGHSSRGKEKRDVSDAVARIIEYHNIYHAYQALPKTKDRLGRSHSAKGGPQSLMRRFGISKQKLEYVARLDRLPTYGASYERVVTSVMPALKEKHPEAYDWYARVILDHLDKFPHSTRPRMEQAVKRLVTERRAERTRQFIHGGEDAVREARGRLLGEREAALIGRDFTRLENGEITKRTPRSVGTVDDELRAVEDARKALGMPEFREFEDDARRIGRIRMRASTY